jgi:metal-responsive CopG/Arc/MetJ family transcriptional regulator
MKYPIHRVNVDFTADILKELDEIAKELNVSRQAVIKTYLRQALVQRYLAKKARLHKQNNNYSFRLTHNRGN